MKKTTLLFLFLAILSCQNKDEQITKKPWYLNRKFITEFIDDETTTELIFYKISERKIVLKFNKEGSLKVNEDKGDKYATVLWEWKSDDKKYFTIKAGSDSGDYHILELSNKELIISKQNLTSSKNEILYFNHIDDPDWKDDESIDRYNKVSELK